MSGAPIIFIHYGPAGYLRQALASARRANPEKRIILLGDGANRKYAAGAAEYFPFEDFSSAAKHAEFQKVFQVIQGERHRFHKQGGIEAWLKFVFRRWFLIEEFLLREKIDSFWTFDSDTLILAPLWPREPSFSSYDAMTQCKDACLNGWVGSRALVSRYTCSILDQFRDPEYLVAQRGRLRTHAGLAFNEMDAFLEFRRRGGVKTAHGEIPVDGEIFDDALAFSDGFEGASEKVLGKTTIKRLCTDGKSIFAKQKESGHFVRMLTCNMSWMPDYMWRRIIAATRGGKDGSRGTRGGGCVREENLREISVREPWADCMLRQAKMAVFKMQRALRGG